MVRKPRYYQNLGIKDKLKVWAWTGIAVGGTCASIIMLSSWHWATAMPLFAMTGIFGGLISAGDVESGKDNGTNERRVSAQLRELSPAAAQKLDECANLPQYLTALVEADSSR
jgi:hypothetical protein